MAPPSVEDIARRDTDRVLALLRHCGVVDHQYRIAAADQPVRLNKKFRLQWRRIPDASCNKMMQLIIVASAKAVLPLAECSCVHRCR